MKIIIIGEFSSFAKNLSIGFRKNGHDCFVFSWGDGFKMITQDDSCSYTVKYRKTKTFSKKIDFFLFLLNSWKEYLKLRKFVKRMSARGKWDAILVVNPGFIKQRCRFWQAFFTKQMIQSLVSNPNNIYLSACGSDVPYYDYWSKHSWKNQDIINWGKGKYLSRSMIKHHMYYSSFINKVIPVMFGYAQAWRNSEFSQSYHVLDTIPLPVDCSKFKTNNNVKDKIVVFHGIIRPIAKGTSYIKSAMDKLQLMYPDLVECKAEGGLPLDEYLQLLDRTNILIDQSLSDSVGMNGLYGLAMGKVVMGGNELDNQREYQEFDCPVININPDANQIYHELEKIILSPQIIHTLSLKSREYVENVHDSQHVAKRYIEVFEQWNR